MSMDEVAQISVKLGRHQGIVAAAEWLKKQSKLSNDAHALAMKMLRELETIVANAEAEARLDAMRGGA
jgi:hypothetical protein